MNEIPALICFVLIVGSCAHLVNQNGSDCTLEQYNNSPVKTVGGCDKQGSCGVVLKDGTQLIAEKPVVGAPAKYYACKRRGDK